MLTFEVKDMTCSHCARAITQAVKAVDRDARIDVELRTHRVQVESATVGVAALVVAIEQAGYTAVPVQHEAPATHPARTGGCCGCSR